MYQIAQPAEELKKYIDYFWMGEQERPDHQVLSHHAVASSKLECQFHYRGEYATTGLSGQREVTFQAGLYGQGNTYKQYFSTREKTSIFSVRFHPLAAITLFDLPASELTNQNADILTALGQ